MGTGRQMYHWHTGTMTRRSEGLDAREPVPTVEIHPSDAAELGVGDGETVRITSRRGSIRAQVKISAKAVRGTVFLPFHYGYWDDPERSGHRRAANELTITGYDPVSEQPYFKFAPARIRKLEREAA